MRICAPRLGGALRGGGLRVLLPSQRRYVRIRLNPIAGALHSLRCGAKLLCQRPSKQTNKHTHKTRYVLRSRRGRHGIMASMRTSSKQHNDPAPRTQAGARARPLPTQPRPRRRAHTVGSGGGWSSFVSMIQRGAGAAIGCAFWPCGIVPEGEVAAAAHARTRMGFCVSMRA